jgi:hypothetical protein
VLFHMMRMKNLPKIYKNAVRAKFDCQAHSYETHPLPQVVLTVSKSRFRPSRLARRARVRAWTQSVPPAVAGGSISGSLINGNIRANNKSHYISPLVFPYEHVV